MRSFIPVGRWLAAAAAVVYLLSLSERAAAQAPKPADKLAIDMAIDKGVKYLRETQNPSGSWGKGTGAGPGKGWGVGYASLACVALIECGVPVSDPGIVRAAKAVRSFADAGELVDTYEISLAILFLDRLNGGKADRTRIQYLAARLMAGQSMNGGWTYKVPKLTGPETVATLAALRKMSPPPPPFVPSSRDRPGSLGLCIKASDDVVPKAPPPPFDADKGRADAMKFLTPVMRGWAVFQPTSLVAASDPEKKIADCNSNTHFAIVAVWAARKYDVPVEPTLALMAKRFRVSQARDGGWAYNFVKGGGPTGTRSMTCVGLLALAIGHVVDPEVGVPPEKDPKVLGGFTWLSKHIGAPTGTAENKPPVKNIGGLYYMWAMERIAVVYDVGKLDKKDWYQWGAEVLLCHQKDDGSWADGGYHGEHEVLNTGFALLFLKRANLTPDLSRRFTVDASALTAKVSKPVEPVFVPDPPQEPEPVAVAPMPHDYAPPPPPKAAPAPVAQPAAAAASPSPKESSGVWLWIVLGIVLLLVLGLVLFFLLRKKGDEEKPKKKKKKKGVKSGAKSEKVESAEKTKVKAKAKGGDEGDEDD